MIGPPSPLRRWAGKNRLSAAHLNQPVDALNSLLASMRDPAPVPVGVECWPGIVWDKGPNGEANYTDERYWVQRAFVQGAEPKAQITVTQETAPSTSSSTTPSGIGFDQNASNIFTVTNLPDLKSHSHTLAKGAFIWVWAYWDSGLTAVAGDVTAGQPDNQKHYLTYSAAVLGATFRVNLTQTGGSNGSQSAIASWTYTAKTLDNVTTLGTVLSPEKGRTANGAKSAATRGLGYYNASGTFVLYEADEPYGTGHC